MEADVSRIKRFMHVQHMIMNSRRNELHAMGLHRGQPRLISVLYHTPGLSKKEISSQLGIQPATVTKMVHRLENNDFLYTEMDVNDSRVSRVFLTEKGQSVHDAVKALYDTYDDLVFGGLEAEEAMALEKILIKIEERLSTEDSCRRGGGKPYEKDV